MKKMGCKSCAIGCISVLCIIIIAFAALCFFTPLGNNLSYIFFGKRYDLDPEYAGIWETIDSIPYAHAYQTEIDNKANTMLLYSTVESASNFIEESGNVIRSVNAYLSSNPTAPEHKYLITVRFTLENSSEPLLIQYCNYDIQDSTGDTIKKTYFFKCKRFGSDHPPRQSDAEQLSRIVFIESIEIKEDGIAPDDLILLDSLDNLHTLRITEKTEVSSEIRNHLKDAHPDCNIIINNDAIQEWKETSNS